MGIKSFIILFVAVFAIGLAVFLYFGRSLNAHKKATIEINGKTFAVDVAKTFVQRAKGLSGREKLEDKEGMFFIFGAPGKYGFWMKDMKIPIDIIWIKENKIAGFEERVDPPHKSMGGVNPQIGASDFSLKTYYPPEPVQYVLEVKAGAVQAEGFKIGDEVRYNENRQ